MIALAGHTRAGQDSSTLHPAAGFANPATDGSPGDAIVAIGLRKTLAVDDEHEHSTDFLRLERPLLAADIGAVPSCARVLLRRSM
jgi:hypothetical protein